MLIYTSKPLYKVLHLKCFLSLYSAQEKVTATVKFSRPLPGKVNSSIPFVLSCLRVYIYDNTYPIIL